MESKRNLRVELDQSHFVGGRHSEDGKRRCRMG